MNYQNSLIRTATTYIAIGILIFQPVIAEVVVDANAAQNNQAGIETSQYGTPIVNIVAPNTNGLSHNKFETYNVDDNHLILNNSTQSTETLISGQISSNPNLTQNSASLILNEVTGNGQSLLQGYTEIAGDQAELIIANPNGITCRGCGFINTPQATLTTGTPQFNGNQFSALSVHGGHIEIDGAGLNAGNLDQINLISESVGLDANLLARELNIIVGLNDVTYQNLHVTVRESVGGNSTELAVDSSSLGGMYANRINLIATEAGVGVKLDGTMATDTDSIIINADGRIELKEVTAETNLSVTSVNDGVDVSELLYANSIIVDAHIDVTNSGVIASSEAANISSETLLNNGDLYAGVNEDNSFNIGQSLTVEATNITNAGQIFATESISLSADALDNSSATITAMSGNVELIVQDTIDNEHGSVEAGSNVEVELNSHFTTQTDASYSAGDTFFISAQSYTNEQEIDVDSHFQVTVTESFSNSGVLETSGDLLIQAADLSNTGTGQISGLNELEILATNNVNNAGTLSSAQAMTIEAEDFYNRGVVATGESLTFNLSNSFTNSNADASGMPIQLSDVLESDDLPEGYGGENGTLVFALGDLNLYADSVVNEFADLFSLGNLSIAKSDVNDASSSVINNSAVINATGNIEIHADTFSNLRFSIPDVDFSSLCDGSSSDLCGIEIVGGESEGVISGTTITEAWLFDQILELDENNTLTDAERYELAQEILFRLYVAAAYSPMLSAGQNLSITGTDISNIGGDIQAGSDITITAENFTNQTVVAATPGPDLVSSNPGFLGGTIGGNVMYYKDDGTLEDQLDWGSQPILSVFLAHTDPGEPFLLLNADSSGMDTYRDNGLPMMVTESGELIAFVSRENDFQFHIDENGDLYLYDGEEVASWYDRWTLEELTDEYISLNEQTNTYQLILGDTAYDLVAGENGALSVDFSDQSPLIEFETQAILDQYKTTAQSSIDYNVFDQPLQMESIATTFFGGTLQAGGDIVITATNSFSNGLTTSNADIDNDTPQLELPTVEIDPNVPTSPSPDAGANDHSNQFSQLSNAVPDESEFSRVEVDTTIPTGGGIFAETDSDEYLVATNASVAQFIESFGSDYLLDQLGYQPEEDVKRLGDGFYETYLVREAILSQTGSRFVNSSLRNDQAQMRYLMDNAVVAQEAMQLTIGVRLNAQQVAALTHDMLWLEEKIVNGERVLVPTLYLANVNSSDVSPEGNVLARSISINAGSFQNSGGFVSQSFVDVKSKGDLSNQGNISAVSDIRLASGGDLKNSGNVVTDSSLLVQAAGDIDTTKGSQMVAENTALIAENDINLAESNLFVSGDLSLLSGGNVSFSSVRLVSGGSTAIEAKGDVTSASNTGNQIKSGGALALTAGENVQLNNTRLSANEDISITAQNGGVSLNSVAIETNSNLDIISSASISAGNAQIATNDATLMAAGDIDLAGVDLSVEENVSLQADGNNSISKSDISSANGTVNILSASGDVELYDTQVSSGDTLNVHSASGSVVARGTDVSAEEAVNIIAQGGTITANQLTASTSGDITLSSKDDVSISNSSAQGLNVSIESLSGSINSNNVALNAQENVLVKAEAGSISNSYVQLSAGESIAVQAGKDLVQEGTRIEANDTAALLAGGKLSNTNGSTIDSHSLVMASGEDMNNESNLEMAGDISLTAQNITNTGRIAAGENLTLSAVEDLTNIAAELSAGQDMSLVAGNNIVIDAIGTKTESQNDGGKQSSLTYEGSTITVGNNLTMSAGNDLKIMSSDVNAGGDIALAATGDMTVGAYQNEYYSYYEKTKENKFLLWTTSETTTIKESFKTENVASNINAGGNLTVNSRVNDDGSVSAGYDDGKVSISGSELTAGEQMVVYGGDVSVTSQKEIDYSLESKEKSGTFFGVFDESNSSSSYEELIAQSRLASQEDMNLLSAGNITILGSDVLSGGNLNLDAVGDIAVLAEQTILELEETMSESGFGGWDALYETTTTRSSSSNTTTHAGNLTAENDINLNGSNITFAGSNASAGNNLTATADIGDIRIISVEEAHSSNEFEETFSVSMPGVGDLFDFEGYREDAVDDQQLSITLLEGEYSSFETDSQSTTVQSSNLSAGSNLTLKADQNIEIIGSNVSAANDENSLGLVALTAGEDVTIAEAYETTNDTNTEMEGTAELSLTVKNEVVEAYKAYEAVVEANKQVGDLQDDYAQYQKDVENLESRLASMEADYAQGIPGVSYEHIEELSSLIKNLKSDDAKYQQAIALAVADLASKTTIALQQTATASASMGSLGFSAGLELDVNGTQTTTNTTSSTAVGSTVSGHNIIVTSGMGNDGNDTSVNLSGSNLLGSGAVIVNTDQLNVTSAQNTYSSNTESQQTGFNASISTSGGGMTNTVSGGSSESTQSGTQHTNSNIVGNAVSITTSGDANFAGANVNGNQLNLTVGGDLNVESQQATSSANSENKNISLGSTSGQNNLIGSFGTGSSDHSVTQTQVTSLVGGAVDISVEGNTHLESATVAAIDSDGNDNGELTLTTDTLTVSHLTDNSLSTNENVGANSSLSQNGQGSANVGNVGIQMGTGTAATSGIALATLGEGVVTVEADADSGMDSTEALNRDVENTTESLYETDTGMEVAATIDTRLFTEQGHDQIAEDLLRTGLIVDTIGQIMKSENLSGLDFVSELKQSNDIYDAVKEEIAKDPALAAALQDPDLTPEQKENMLNQITSAVMVKLNYDVYNNNIIATTETGVGDAQIAGHFNRDTEETYINDPYHSSTEELVTTTGHEMGHAIENNRGDEFENEYAQNMGENLSNFTDLALDINGYDEGMAQTNNHIGNDTSLTVVNNNAIFSELDKSQGDDYLLAQQMKDLADELVNCKTETCKTQTAELYLKKSAENTQFMMTHCANAGATTGACLAEVQEQYQAIEDFKSGEVFDSIYEQHGDLSDEEWRNIDGALLVFHQINLGEQSLRGQLASGALLEEVAQSFGLSPEEAAVFATVGVGFVAAYTGAKRGNQSSAQDVKDIADSSSKNENSKNDLSNSNKNSVALVSPKYEVAEGFKVQIKSDGKALVTGPRGATYESTGFYTSEGQAIYKSLSGNGYVTLNNGRTPVNAPPDLTKVPLHHICTNKCTVDSDGKTAWTNEFKKFFDGANLNINSAVENLVSVPGHRGPHPQNYHKYVYAKLYSATEGMSPNTAEYKNAVTNTLNSIKIEANTPGSVVNDWLTGNTQ